MSINRVGNNLYVDIDHEVYLVGKVNESNIDWIGFGHSFFSEDQRAAISADLLNCE